MAYLIDIQRQCDKCKASRATKRLFNTRNAPCGDYCSKCAPRALKELQRREQPVVERPRIEQG